jgi:hypothetical protein
VTGKLCVEHCTLLFAMGKTRPLEHREQRLTSDSGVPFIQSTVHATQLLMTVMGSAGKSMSTMSVHASSLQDHVETGDDSFAALDKVLTTQKLSNPQLLSLLPVRWPTVTSLPQARDSHPRSRATSKRRY